MVDLSFESVPDFLAYKIDLSFEEAANQFLARKEIGDLSPQTVKWYRNVLNGYRNHLVEHADNPTRWAHPDTLNAYLAHSLERGLTVKTVDGYRRALAGLFKWLKESGAVRVSPMARVPRPAVPKKEKPQPTDEEFAEIRRQYDEAMSKIAREVGGL